MLCLTHPLSPTRDARDGSRGWWEGRRGEDSLLRFLPSHHTPRATRRGCYRWLETSQMLCFLKVLTFASSYIAWPCPICFTWPHSWPNQSMSLVTSDDSLRTVGGSTWKRRYGAIDWGLKDRARPFFGNKNKILLTYNLLTLVAGTLVMYVAKIWNLTLSREEWQDVDWVLCKVP